MKFNKLALVTLLATSAISMGAVADQSNTGIIKFSGTVVNTPCNIDQESLVQDISFGQLSRKSLESKQAAEKEFSIKFTNCNFDEFTKNESGEFQPVKTMNMEFTGQNYADDAHTLLATSTGNKNNLGISIDGFEFGKPTNILDRIVNKVGDNTLTFKALAQIVDPSKEVVEGTFSAISNFRISYE